MIMYNAHTRTITIEQVSMVLGQHFVLTFQEQKGDVFTQSERACKMIASGCGERAQITWLMAYSMQW
jgi:hypothetical protein